MSTYWYMGCDEHKEQAAKMVAVTRNIGRHIDNPDELLDFLLEHKDCKLSFFSEYDDERYEYARQEKAKGER